MKNAICGETQIAKWARWVLPNLGTLIIIAALVFARSVGAVSLGKPLAQGSTVPTTLSYQGRLTDAAGLPLPVGLYTMRFSLYSVPVGGSPLWTELHDGAGAVPVLEGGFFNALLGEVEPLPDPFPDAPLYLGITIGTDQEMTPREPLTSVPFAFNALGAKDGGGVPVGTVISWWRADASTPLPSDEWAIADGSIVNDPESPLYGETLPNLTDRFVMGAAPGNIGTAGGANILNLAHSHTVSSHRHLVDSHGHSIPDHSHSISGETTEVYAMWDGGHYNSGSESYRYAMNTYQTTWYTRHNHRVSLNSGGWSGNTGNTSPYTDYQSPGTDSRLSGTTDNRPAYVGLLYLVRIK